MGPSNSKFIYSGKYNPRNPTKYIGDTSKIYYRSSWELALMSWLDRNSSVKCWASEETVVKYLCPTDNKVHRYFIDFSIQFSNGDVYLIEVKPERQTIEPVAKRGKSKKRLLNEVLTYTKNRAKWNAATSYADSQGWKFAVWTENTLKQLGIVLI